MRVLITILLLFCMISAGWGQRPKLDLRGYAGYHNHIFVYRQDQIERESLSGYQGGLAFRTTWRRLMGEGAIGFIRTRIPVDIEADTSNIGRIDIKMNSLEVPLKVGYIPVKTAYFKWYVFTGLNMRFNTKILATINDEEITIKPKEINLAYFNLDWLIGTQVDIGRINLEFMYHYGITNSLRENIRTNSHEILINAGFWF